MSSQTQTRPPIAPELPPAPPEIQQAIEQLRHRAPADRKPAKEFLLQRGEEVIPHLLVAAYEGQYGSLHRANMLKVVEALKMEIGLKGRAILSSLALEAPYRVREQSLLLLEKLNGEWIHQGIADPQAVAQHQMFLHTVSLRCMGLEGPSLGSLLSA